MGPGPKKSIFKHLLMTVLDRGGGVVWGGDMAKNHVQKHCETYDRTSQYMTRQT